MVQMKTALNGKDPRTQRAAGANHPPTPKFIFLGRSWNPRESVISQLSWPELASRY